MRRLFPLLFALPLSLMGDLVAYQATSQNTPCTGYGGQVVAVQFASTNTNGTATLSSVTDLSVGGRTVSFTNTLATATLDNGTYLVIPSNIYVAPRQRIVVSGTAFPGGSATVWLSR